MKNYKYKKKPNRGSLARVILSKYDDKHIKEIKIRYEKSRRLDKLNIINMNFEDTQAVFNNIEFNGKDGSRLLSDDNKKIEIYINKNKHYIISVEQTLKKELLTFLDPSTNKKYSRKVTVKDDKYYIKGELYEPKDEIVEKKDINIKFKVYLNDLIASRDTSCEAEIITSKADIFKKIAHYDNKNQFDSSDIYKIKRYIGFRSSLNFYYTFIDHFFDSIVKKSKKEKEKKKNNFHNKSEEIQNSIIEKINNSPRVELSIFNENQITDYFIKEIKNLFIDNLIQGKGKKNKQEGILHNYVKDPNKQNLLKEDIKNIIDLFKGIRIGLAHFNYNFFEAFISNELEGIKLQKKKESKKNEFNYKDTIQKVKILDILIEQIEKLNILSKLNAIDDNDRITILDAEDIKLKRILTYYIKLDIKHPGLRKLISSFLIKDGAENCELKDYIVEQEKNKKDFNTLKNAYYTDISSYRKYKDIYNKHKNYVTKKEKLLRGMDKEEDSCKKNKLGIEINRINNENINPLKIEMNQLTKLNYIKRLEYRLRVAFGFIYTEYASIEKFQNNVSIDLRDGKFKDKYGEDIIKYLKNSYEADKQFFATGKKDKKDRKLYKFEELNIGLKDTVEKDDIFLKTIILFSIFIPKEFKGDFLGFISSYYHKTLHIDQDTKDIEIEQENEDSDNQLPQNTKLKNLSQNIKKVNMFKNRFGMHHNDIYDIFKSINIEEHDIKDEGLHKFFYTKILKYYQFFFKFIEDYEIYVSYTKAPNQFISENSSFVNLLKSSGINTKDNQVKQLLEMRNNIAHQNIDSLIQHFHVESTDKKSIKNVSKSIINFIESHQDIKKVLQYDSANDFKQKVIQFKKKIEADIDYKENQISSKNVELKNLKSDNNKAKKEITNTINQLQNIKKINYYLLEKV